MIAVSDHGRLNENRSHGKGGQGLAVIQGISLAEAFSFSCGSAWSAWPSPSAAGVFKHVGGGHHVRQAQHICHSAMGKRSWAGDGASVRSGPTRDPHRRDDESR